MNYDKCINELQNYDAVGVNLNLVPEKYIHNATTQNFNNSYHYSGNFWWSKSSYIKKLTSKIGDKYLDPELWIGSNDRLPKKFLSLWQSNIDHYSTNYKKIIYENNIDKYCINQI